MQSLKTYSPPQRFFHWAMAAIILAALGLGLWASFLEAGTPTRKFILEIHKSLGLTAALLLLPRLTLRLIWPTPATSENENRTARLAAYAAHWTLYGLMVFMPITGYMFSAAGGYSLPWFGLFQWPRLLRRDSAIAAAGEWLHDHGAWILYVVVGLHLAAVCWHQFYKKDAVLSRMLTPRTIK
ncbi:cytochrome b [Labrys sp. KNU-23]|uniref:cytochrome b n=1 Tax=Labrys TaxID=204476 RepID=UPI0011F09B03|nr:MULTISPECIES: cytochrome b [Labrys]MDT3377357.1 cytochrome b [Labrys neptuniae]QEN84806.1 cytochrome b [Labrys sp. KNU-23]